MRKLLLLLLFHGCAALSLSAPTPATPFISATAAATAPRELMLIEHAMPVMPPHLYEDTLRKAFEASGDEILRWYIARVDGDIAIAEVVVLPS